MPYAALYDTYRLIRMKKAARGVTIHGYELRLMPKSFSIPALPFKNAKKSIVVDVIEFNESEFEEVIANYESLKVVNVIIVEADGIEVALPIGKEELRKFTNQRIFDGDFLAYLQRLQNRKQERQMETGLEDGFTILQSTDGYQN